MKSTSAHNRARKLGHHLVLQTWSPTYERWQCDRCGGGMSTRHTPINIREYVGVTLERKCVPHELAETPAPMKARKPAKPVQSSLFDNAAVDDWGDSPALRKQNAGMKRLL